MKTCHCSAICLLLFLGLNGCQTPHFTQKPRPSPSRRLPDPATSRTAAAGRVFAARRSAHTRPPPGGPFPLARTGKVAHFPAACGRVSPAPLPSPLSCRRHAPRGVPCAPEGGAPRPPCAPRAPYLPPVFRTPVSSPHARIPHYLSPIYDFLTRIFLTQRRFNPLLAFIFVFLSYWR